MLAGDMIVELVMMLARLIGRMIVLDTYIAGVTVLVRMHVKGSNEQEHGKQAAERPAGDLIDRAGSGQRVRQQMKEGHAKHQPAYKAHGKLHPAMRELDHSG